MDEYPKAELLVIEGKEAGRMLPLRPSKVVVIGREGNLRLDDAALSRRHAEIRYEGGVYQVRDVGSSWGTFVNDERIQEWTLADGDRIRVGNHILAFSMEDEMIHDATIALPPGRTVEEHDDVPIASAPVAALAVEEDDDDIPSASPTLTPDSVRMADPPAAPTIQRPSFRFPVQATDESAVEKGYCANCRKLFELVDGPAPDQPAPNGLTYCKRCVTQYPLLGRIIANHICGRVLGAGGMGVVYRAEHQVMGRIAAMKTLKMLHDADPVMVQRLLLEATAGGRIQHPAIVSVHDTGEQDDIAYVAMEYINGENLADVLDREGRLPVHLAVHVGVQVADALAAGFELGYIHRDIKPENILVTAEGDVKVTDFGLAKNLKEGELGGLTRTGQVLGTMIYIAPEQIVSSKGSDQRADIYSLGATIFHLAAGRPPFDSKQAIKLLMQIRQEKPPLLRECAPEAPEPLERIVAKCLEKDPADRYQSPEELLADLRLMA